ncbi:MAG: dephospho-CoA kinase [Tidjanibacter sp.]|nr:dephospho-CoA kinase [Tidjanibacter sp.]
MKRVAITGGIGSGKSTVCRALAALSGAPIYDSDSRAKEIMATHPDVRQELIELFGEEVFAEGVLNRAFISSRVFGNQAMLQRLNAIVHPRVVADFEQWAESQCSRYVILESALLFTSPLVGHYDLAVVVDAPLEMRVERCVRRDGATPEEVRRRIGSQMSAEQMRQRADIVVEADGRDLRPAVEEIDRIISTK